MQAGSTAAPGPCSKNEERNKVDPSSCVCEGAVRCASSAEQTLLTLQEEGAEKDEAKACVAGRAMQVGSAGAAGPCRQESI